MKNWVKQHTGATVHFKTLHDSDCIFMKWMDVNSQNRRLINDVRYQEWTEVTLGCQIWKDLRSRVISYFGYLLVRVIFTWQSKSFDKLPGNPYSNGISGCLYWLTCSRWQTPYRQDSFWNQPGWTNYNLNIVCIYEESPRFISFPMPLPSIGMCLYWPTNRAAPFSCLLIQWNW